MLYGRRQGKRLRPGQRNLVENLLPLIEINLTPENTLDPRACFSRDIDDIWLEIGFGGGEHLAWQAKTYPRIGFVGCEPFLNGIVKLLSRIRSMELENVRLYRDDARLLIARLPANIIGRAFILFPDPWPKLRHHKRRLISEGFWDRWPKCFVMRPRCVLQRTILVISNGFFGISNATLILNGKPPCQMIGARPA